MWNDPSINCEWFWETSHKAANKNFDFLVSNRRAVSREHNDTKIKTMLLSIAELWVL